MTITSIGIIHPGEMGVSIAVSAQRGGHEVYWASDNRSAHTRARADKYLLRDLRTIEALCQTCGALISVCPPHAADGVADEVLRHGFAGLYLDANAISPQRARRISGRMMAAGAVFVDGGIIGGPAWEAGTTILYLSGPQADKIAALFTSGPLETAILGPEIGQASALKMCYAAWTKGRTALLCGILAAAVDMGVWEALAGQWERDWPGFAEEAGQRVQRVTAKSWRFAGEMEEIAATFEATGLPGGFQRAAAEVYGRISLYKDAPSIPELESVLRSLLEGSRFPE